MREDSPPQFITIRTPERSQIVYQLALRLVEHVHQVLEHANARLHLKDRLDRATTSIAIHLARAHTEIKVLRYRQYRDIIVTVTDIGTILDIFERQQATTMKADLASAQQVARQLLAELAPLAAIAS